MSAPAANDVVSFKDRATADQAKPHNDLLVIELTIQDIDVARVFLAKHSLKERSKVNERANPAQKPLAGELNRHAGQLTGELNHHVGQLAGELNRRVVILARRLNRHAGQLAGELNRRVVALARRAQPSRQSARRRAQPSRRTARRRDEPTCGYTRPASSTVTPLAGELNRGVVVLAGELDLIPACPTYFDSRIFRIAVISDLRDHILPVSF
ncbi:hypothetical protein F2Q69_00059649 [Brassica cretica]|uniref:Uncharacterized protein n=1 Tax=Brassica cretica TaxID=69181 RepID=A0A8S9RA89_BRACR|nr:hypothetical protein F2Q69_00059649 [Brassica cretica]